MVLPVEAHVGDSQLQIKRYRCINLCQGKIKVLLRVCFYAKYANSITVHVT